MIFDSGSSSEQLISTRQIAELVQSQLNSIASELRPDVLAALRSAQQQESCPQAAKTLEMLVENARLAADTGVPLCQDTGTVWVLLEIGVQLQVDLRGLQGALDAVVADSFAQHCLRASTVRDALSNRGNPGTNTPAFVDIVSLAEAGDESDYSLSVHTMLKGAGSDNASALTMLSPGSGEEEIVQLVLDLVREKASNACPPLIIGIGIGGTFDKVAGLSKRALLRPLNQTVDQAASSDMTAGLEQRILQQVNTTNIGPAGLGGKTTALAVHIETAPSHIASLPAAINLCCHSLRSRSSVITVC
ncbi:MAG: fumarate hydratase [Coriobacteriia bacterium]|nr:fumarate hydratase [Coriobacteriia bacterium]